MIVQFSVKTSLPISVIDKIEVADSESDYGLPVNVLVSEIFAFYHLLGNARSRPGRRNHVHFN